MRHKVNITIPIKQEVMYLPSNCVIVNFVHRDPDLYFQCHSISKNIYYIILKTVKMTFIVVITRHRNAPLRMLYIVILTYTFKVTNFLEIYNYVISEKGCELAKLFWSMNFIKVYIRPRMLPLPLLYIVTLTHIFKNTTFKMLISGKGKWRELAKVAQVRLL